MGEIRPTVYQIILTSVWQGPWYDLSVFLTESLETFQNFVFEKVNLFLYYNGIKIGPVLPGIYTIAAKHPLFSLSDPVAQELGTDYIIRTAPAVIG